MKFSAVLSGAASLASVVSAAPSNLNSRQSAAPPTWPVLDGATLRKEAQHMIQYKAYEAAYKAKMMAVLATRTSGCTLRNVVRRREW